MTEKLKPCPFCGNEDIEYELTEPFDMEIAGNRKVHSIYCSCLCQMAVDGFYEIGNEKDRLIKAWNARPDS